MKMEINEKQMLKTLKNLRFFDLAIQYLDTLKVMGILEKQIPDTKKGFEWESCYISHDTKLKLFIFGEKKTVVGDIASWIMMDSGDIVEDIRPKFKSQFGF